MSPDPAAGASPVTDELRVAIARVVDGDDLDGEEIAAAFGRIMDGLASPAQIGGLLIALRMKGESAAEIAGAAQAMRARAVPIACPERSTAVDTCGTGGDGSGSVNVSTLAAIVAAAAGVRVAKHGNRASTSRAGSADVLEALGVKIDAEIAVVERCIAEVGIGFLFAPAFHTATRHASGPRRELGVRTLFNLLGPLTNPAGVGGQVVGVFAARHVAPVAAALGQLGCRRAFVLHGAGGLDEVAVRGPTLVAEWHRGTVTQRELSPASFGLDEADPAGLAGGDAADNAAIARRVLGGELGAVRSAIVMEAALAVVAAGDVDDDLRTTAARAEAAIDSGAAARVLATWSRVSHEAALP